MNEIKWNEEWGNEKRDEVFFSKSWLFLAQPCLKPWTTISLSAPQADDTLKRWSGLAMSFFILKQWKKHFLIREVGCGFPEQEIVWQQRFQDTCRWSGTVKRCKSHLFSPQLRVSETIWVLNEVNHEPLRDTNMEKSGSKQGIPKCWISLVDYKFTHMLENH